MKSWLQRLIGLTPNRDTKRAKPLRASYDAAATGADAQRDWQGVDGLAADAAASPAIRAVVRQRGRHEAANNPYTDGMLQTLAGDVIGKTPRLRMRTGAKSVDTLIEREFADWMRLVRLPSYLRLAIETVAAQGEIFATLFENPALPSIVKLDARWLEPDQIATPDIWINSPNDVDGIEVDRYGNPTYYHVLRQHPGDARWFPTGTFTYDRYPARDVLHLFKVRRPGQRRGLPRIMSSLPLFPQRRSFRHSTLTAARIAAQLGAVLLKSEAEANDSVDDIEAGTSMEIEHGMMTTLPRGYDSKQMEPQQPATTFAEFDNKLISESARPLNMPRNIALCDSSEYNYASGRLDHQTYDRSIDIDHGDIEDVILNPLLDRWLFFATKTPGYLPARTASLLRDGIPHTWLWRKRPHVDPSKEADAQRTRLETGMTTIGRELADEALDFEDHREELAAEVAWYRENGLIHPAERKATLAAPVGEEPDEEEPAVGNNGNGNGRAAASGNRLVRRGLL